MGRPDFEPFVCPGQNSNGSVAHLDVSNIDYFLSDGRQLLNGVGFRVGDGAKAALVGPTARARRPCCGSSPGTDPDDGAVARSGGLGVMRQFVGQSATSTTVRDLLVRRAAGAGRRRRAPGRGRARDDGARRRADPDALRPGARRLGRRRRLRAEVAWDTAPWPRSACRTTGRKYRERRTLSGGEQKRLVLEALLRGPGRGAAAGRAGQLPGRARQALAGGAAARDAKTVLLRQPRPGAAGQRGRPDRHPRAGRAGHRLGPRRRVRHLPQAREGPHARLEELRNRWDEEHAKLKRAGAHATRARRPISPDMASATTPPRPGWRSSRRPVRRRSRAARAERRDAAHRRPHRPAGGRSPSSWS